jgi:hypothetical protein
MQKDFHDQTKLLASTFVSSMQGIWNWFLEIALLLFLTARSVF